MNGYARIQRETISGRQLEREVFQRITARLKSTNLDEPGGMAARAKALCENRQLWTTLAIDLATEGNVCPPEVKASLLSLAAFVETTTARALAGDASIDILVEINENIARGLSGADTLEAA